MLKVETHFCFYGIPDNKNTVVAFHLNISRNMRSKWRHLVSIWTRAPLARKGAHQACWRAPTRKHLFLHHTPRIWRLRRWTRNYLPPLKKKLWFSSCQNIIHQLPSSTPSTYYCSSVLSTSSLIVCAKTALLTYLVPGDRDDRATRSFL